MKKRKLLVVSGCLATGGAERFVSNLLTFLDRDHFELHLALCTDNIEYHLPDHVHLHILHNTNPLYSIRTIFRLAGIINKINPNIILSNIALTNRLTGTALKISKNRPAWIARIGNNPSIGGRSKIRNTLNIIGDRIVYPSADHFVVNSTGLKSALNSVHPCTLGKTDVLYNPIDFDHITIEAKKTGGPVKANGSFVFLHAGRFHRQKRHDLLIEAFSIIKNKQSKPVELWLLGDGYLKNEVRKQVNTHQMTDSVRFLGHLENPYPIYKKANAFILTSDWEGMPNTLIEAMGLGLPCVATDCPFGPGEIIEDGVSGYLAPAGKEEKIALLMAKVLNSDNLDSMKKEASKRVNKIFAHEKIVHKWQELFLSLPPK